MDTLEHFTESARWVVKLSGDETIRLNHTSVGLEHILFGLVRERRGIAKQVLTEAGLSVDVVDDLLQNMISADNRETHNKIHLTPDVKEILGLALNEARRAMQNQVGTDHLLLALASQANGKIMLTQLNIDPDVVYQHTWREIQIVEDKKQAVLLLAKSAANNQKTSVNIFARTINAVRSVFKRFHG